MSHKKFLHSTVTASLNTVIPTNKLQTTNSPKPKTRSKILKMYLASRYLPLCQHCWRYYCESPFYATQEWLSLIFIIIRFLFDHSLFYISRHELTMRDAWENVHLMEIGFFSSFLDQKFPFLFLYCFVEMQMKTFCAYCVSKMTRLYILREWKALNDIFEGFLCMNCLRKLLDRGILL